jgi:hypothetical protein
MPEYKQTEAGAIPEDWEVKPLGDVLNKGRLGGNYPNQLRETEYPLMKMGNIARGYPVVRRSLTVLGPQGRLCRSRDWRPAALQFQRIDVKIGRLRQIVSLQRRILKKLSKKGHNLEGSPRTNASSDHRPGPVQSRNNKPNHIAKSVRASWTMLSRP